jgi:hypothetical protein
VVVGAPGVSNLGPGIFGNAYVFVKPTTGWKSSTETGKLVPSDASIGSSEPNHLYGWSVAVSGNTIAVGAPIIESLAAGAVYVFLKPPTGWNTVNETAKLTASDGVLKPGGLGRSVAIGGNAVAAGAPFYQGRTYTGAIYLFVRPATGWSNMTQTFKRNAPAVGDYLGWSVAFGNTTVVAGAPASSHWTGAAYIFNRMP